MSNADAPRPSPPRANWLSSRTVILGILLLALIALAYDWNARRQANVLMTDLSQWLPPNTMHSDTTYVTPNVVKSVAGREPDAEAEPVPLRRHLLYTFRGALHFYTVHAFFAGPESRLTDVSLTVDRSRPRADNPDDLPWMPDEEALLKKAAKAK